MDHTWIGDLVVKLVSPDGTVVTLMSRPGYAETADDGTGGAGTDDNLTRTAPVTFQGGATTSAEDMGLGDDNATVCEDDGICTYTANHGAAAVGNLTTFVGKTIAGTWKMCVGDAAPGDTGTIDRVTLTISN
jgi:subtilisin-like proprotein convertase family protein